MVLDFYLKLVLNKLRVMGVLPLFIPFSLKEIMSFATKKSMTKYLNDYIIDYSHKILLQILYGKSCNHILMIHLAYIR